MIEMEMLVKEERDRAAQNIGSSDCLFTKQERKTQGRWPWR
jgi:hypothetical protein